jgi:hypothetical protein
MRGSPTLRSLAEFFSQNDNQILDEEADETLWVTICIIDQPAARAAWEVFDVLLQNAAGQTAATYRLTLEQVSGPLEHASAPVAADSPAGTFGGHHR